MDYDFIRIGFEKQLSQELREIFEGDIIENILTEAKIEPRKDYFKTIMEGHNFKITDRLAPKINSICQKVIEKLEFEEEIEFFITNSPDINAAAYYKSEESHSHLIALHSGLIEKFDDEELQFVIGHEIGHLISKSADLMRIIDFLFPVKENMPLVFQHKISLWYKLAELTADRFGYLAMPNFDKCLSNFFKLSSGLNLERIAFDANAYYLEIKDVLEKYIASDQISYFHHPVNPIRIEALKLFSESDTCASAAKDKKFKKDVSLEKNIQKLVDILLSIDDSEIGVHRKNFVASGGLIMAGIDSAIEQKELELILQNLANFIVFPRKFLDKISKSGKVDEIFQNSAIEILKINPAERYGMLTYLIDMALSDNDIFQKEIELLFQIGVNLFGFSHKEIAQQIAGRLQNQFVPKMFR